MLKRVGKNIPDASTLLQKFSGTASKRVYILLKSDDENGGTKTFGICTAGNQLIRTRLFRIPRYFELKTFSLGFALHAVIYYWLF